MVRIGEYSPNFRGNKLGIEGGNRGIFGFGEYEEKRKYYNEQRKLEYKQYIAQQALKTSCSGSSDSVSQIPTVEPTVFVESLLTDVGTSVRKDVATQTSSIELRDACTNTVVPVSTEGRDYILSSGSMPGNLKQDSVNALTSQIKESNCHYLNAASQYERDLRAQIEERKNHARELERRERQEAESRERWMAEEARRELERHRVEEMRLKAWEDCRKQRLEEFRNCSEQLQREAKESRRTKMRERREVSRNVTVSAGSDSNGNVHSSREVVDQQVSKSVPKASAIQSQVSDKLKLSGRKQCYIQEECLEQGISRQEVPRKATEKETTPKPCPPHLQKGKDGSPLPSPEEDCRSKILSHLGEIRRRLATEQIKMEGALKKINSPDKKM
ncbi:caldesmon-like [Hetaerina americana]|uniref:caldesmon-like n=1 Tax=Hetaerina americana TaxID=62018 RepID=UPI003A7F2D4E